MLLTIQQTQELLNIINKNQVIALGKELGPDFLSEQDVDMLKRYNVDTTSLYTQAADTLFTSFHFGMLAEALGAAEAANMSYEQLKGYISHGDYIPLTAREVATLNSVKAQKFNDLKTLNGKIFKDVNQVLVNKGLNAQRAFIREEIGQGLLNKQNVRQIANEIAIKTGDWSRDFDRIVAYTSTLAFEEGKAAMIQRTSGDEDPIVYKTVFEGACKKCIELYLTKGWGSAPRLFKLSELRGMGSNIGVKQAEWHATLGPVHPFCRCVLNYKKPEIIKPKRAPIRIWIGGQERFV